ncbi:hypothetical protein CRYUN_Cryun21dG0090300 [Craigia yunnanensis]
MAQYEVVRNGEEEASTSLRQDLRENLEMCFMTIEAGGTHLVGEGQSIMRHPLFVGDNYAYWKIRIMLFIQATDYEA